MARAYEFAVAEWGWTHTYIEDELTYGQLVLYLDAAQDRLVDRFDETVAAARIGRADNRTYERWRSRARAARMVAKGREFVARATEHAVMSLALRNPEYVVVEGR